MMNLLLGFLLGIFLTIYAVADLEGDLEDACREKHNTSLCARIYVPVQEVRQ